MSNRRKLKAIDPAMPQINGVPILIDPSSDDRPGADKVEGKPGPGAVNGYQCPECDMYTLVIHKDRGVTPMFLACRVTKDCPGTAVSLGYPPGTPPPGIMRAVRWEWFRPDKKAFNKLTPEMQDHVRRGGLVLRERT